MFNEDTISDIIMKLNDGVQVGECLDKIYAMCFLYAEYISNEKGQSDTIPETFFIINEVHEATISVYLQGLRELFSYFGIPIQSYSGVEGEAHWMRSDEIQSFMFETHTAQWVIHFESKYTFPEQDHIIVDATNNNHIDKSYTVKEKLLSQTERFMREYNCSFSGSDRNYIPLDTQKHVDDMNKKAIDFIRVSYSGALGIPISDTNPLKMFLD